MQGMQLSAKYIEPLTWVTMTAVRAVSFMLILSVSVAAAPNPAFSSGLVVLYPEVRQPYAKIYEDIISGIEETYQSTTNAIAVTPGQSMDYYRTSVEQFDPDTIIALGQPSLKLIEEMNIDVPLVAGAITHTDAKVHGISMVPDVRVIIDKLLLLDSNVQIVHLVINANNRKKRLQDANAYATSKGINLVVHDVSTVQAAASEYRSILGEIENGDAIWLMRDKALNDSALLSQVLETAWKKKVIVFSSNPTHVKRGALFAIYPNNQKLGLSLGLLAAQSETGDDKPAAMTPLRDVYAIVNGRTSRHLGISLSGKVRSEIDIIL